MVAALGFPLTPAANEANRDTGQSYQTQWLERNRFELTCFLTSGFAHEYTYEVPYRYQAVFKEAERQLA
jgi:hypothetical protein